VFEKTNDRVQIKMDELLTIIAGIWQEGLDLDDVSPDDSFVDLAGHSMLALIIIDDINEKLGSDLPPHLLFEEPVLSKFAELVRRELADAPKAF
jgi:acyl carrier protein